MLQQRDGAAGASAPERGADLHQTIDARVRGGDARRPADGHRHAAGALPRRAAASGRLHVRRSAVRALPRRRRREVGARPHGVLQAVRAAAAAGRQRADALSGAAAAQQVEMRTESLTIDVPAGLADGARIRVPGKGHAGRNGGETGDLYITVRVAAAPAVPARRRRPARRRAGRDSRGGARRARSTCRRSTARRGCACRRARSRASGSGCASAASPSPRDGRRGDLVVEVRLVLPKLLDERSKELLREFGRINGEDVAETETRRDGDAP